MIDQTIKHLILNARRSAAIEFTVPDDIDLADVTETIAHFKNKFSNIEDIVLKQDTEFTYTITYKE